MAGSRAVAGLSAQKRGRSVALAATSVYEGNTKKRVIREAVGSCHVQVLGLGSDVRDTLPSLLVFCDSRRYIFNAGEGFQRFCGENHVKLSKMGPLLLTRPTFKAAGGLPGLCLSMSDGAALSSRTHLDLFGPPRTENLVKYVRSFVGLGKLEIALRELGIEKGARMQAMDANDEDGGGGNTRAKKGRGRDAVEVLNDENITIYGTSLEAENDNAESSRECPSMCYECKFVDTPGKFDPKKAAEIGVPNGPERGRLVRGESITLSDGRVINPDEVVGPSRPGGSVLIVDCPTSRHIGALVGSESLSALQTMMRPDGKPQVSAVFHLSPLNVMESDDYKAWIQNFNKEICHIACVSDGSDEDAITDGQSIFSGSRRLQAKLNLVDNQLFPILSALDKPAGQPNLPAGLVQGHNLLRYNIRPQFGLDLSSVPPPVDISGVQSDVMSEIPEMAGLLSTMQDTIRRREGTDASPPEIKSLERGDASVLFLGTGSSAPSKYRNVSGIYLSLEKGKKGMIMDCGEGTLGQLRRHYGIVGTADRLRGLELVWISHIHADHHVGLPGLLIERRRLLGPDAPPLTIIGPRQLKRPLQLMDWQEDLRINWVDCYETCEGMEQPKEVLEPLTRLGIDSILSVPVIHCAHSFACQLVHQKGWKIVYSADTRPCQAVVEMSKGATLLVHEATFEDELIHEALARNHSIIREAVKVGADAGVYRTLLTHFSQRYPKIPDLNGSYTDNRTSIAFDMMEVDLVDLPKLPNILPPLSALFKENDAEEDEEDVGG